MSYGSVLSPVLFPLYITPQGNTVRQQSLKFQGYRYAVDYQLYIR